MSSSRAPLYAAGAVIAAGLIGLAATRTPEIHVLTVQLPDGSIERIGYLGEAPPRIRLERDPLVASAFVPLSDPLPVDPAFAELERMSTAMDLEAEALVGRAGAGPAWDLPGAERLMRVDRAGPPSAARGYAFTTTMTAPGVCARGVEYRWSGDGKPPVVVTHVMGSCGAGHARPAPSLAPAPAAPAMPLTQASYRHEDPATRPGSGTLDDPRRSL